MKVSFPVGKRVFEILELEPEIKDSENAVAVDKVKGILDQYAEKSILNSIKMIAKGKIVLMITHKLSNFEFVDRFFRVSDGKVEEVVDLSV